MKDILIERFVFSTNFLDEVNVFSRVENGEIIIININKALILREEVR